MNQYNDTTAQPPYRFLPLPFGFSKRGVYAGPYRNRPAGMFGVKMAKEIDLPCDISIPTRDYHTPPLEKVREAIKPILDRLAYGEDVYVGCWGGIGRTGTLLAILAKVMGIRDPVGYVRRYYDPCACETEQQEDYVHLFKTGDYSFDAWKARGTAALVDFSSYWGCRPLTGRR